MKLLGFMFNWKTDRDLEKLEAAFMFIYFYAIFFFCINIRAILNLNLKRCQQKSKFELNPAYKLTERRGSI